VTSLPELPEGWTWVRGQRHLQACRLEDLPMLAGLGWTPESSADLPRSLLAGRAPLFELGPDLLVRRWRHGGLLRFATGELYLDPSRPFVELLLAQRLSRAGVPTAQVVAARAQRRLGCLWRLELVVRRISGAIDLGRAMEAARAARGRLPAGLLRATGALVRRLHDIGFEHADLQPNNLLLQDASADPRLVVLDLDGSRFHATMDERARVANLARLARFVARRELRDGSCLTRSDWLRALSGYEPELRARRRMARLVQARLRRSWWLHRLGWLLEALRGERRR
jgi:tRNA A-37 threonylcarbamoyl transferase component Bud32